MLTSINVMTPTPFDDMKPWIIIDPPPCFTVGMTCLGSYAVQVNNFQKILFILNFKKNLQYQIYCFMQSYCK